MALRSFFLVITAFCLSACAETELVSHVAKQTPIAESSKPPGYFKVGSPYRIKGKRYVPRETYNFTQTGYASWYGPKFHGKMTANGETFDKYELTAAHNTLQMPSIVRVTNLENGRSIIVRINDRGPFAKNRIIDLSERSAELLDFKHKGVARVKVEVLPHESKVVANVAKSGKTTRGFEVAYNEKSHQPVQYAQNTAPVPQRRPTSISNVPEPIYPIEKPEALFVQAGSFKNPVKARVLAEQIRDIGRTNINPGVKDGKTIYRVQIGPLDSQKEADKVVLKLAQSNIGEPFLVRH